MAEHLSEREIELIRETVKVVMKKTGHICHFSRDKRKELYEITDEGKDRVKHLVEIADAANLVGIESDGHIVLFSVGRQVTVIGQKAISTMIIGFVVVIIIGLIILFGWRPFFALLAAAKQGG